MSHKYLHHFPYPTDDSTVITKVVTSIAAKLFKPGVRYYKIGVGFLELQSAHQQQMDWLNPSPEDNRLMNVFDDLNNRYGTGSVFLAAEGIEHKWGMKRELLTPQYTTKWNDLPLVKC